MKLVGKTFIDFLIHKFDNNTGWTDYEKNNFYCQNEDGTFTACANESGDCFVEDFKDYKSLWLYFNTDLSLDEIRSFEKATFDKGRINYLDRWSHKIATYIFSTASQETSTGTWLVDFEDIQKQYDIDLKQDKELLDAVCEVLDTDFVTFIADYQLDDDGFDVNLWTNYCCWNTDGEDELWEDE